MENKDHIDIAKSVLEKVKKGDVRMRARWRFVVDAVGKDVLLALLLIAATFTLGLVVYYWRINAVADYFSFGASGARRAFFLVPVELLILSIALVIVAAVFVRHMDWGYRQSITIWVIVGVIIVCSVGIATKTVHERIETASEGQLPLFLERYYPPKKHGMPRPHTLAEIIAIQQHDVTVKYLDDTLTQFNTDDVIVRPQNAELKKGIMVRLMDEDGVVWGVMVIPKERFDERVDMFGYMQKKK